VVSFTPWPLYSKGKSPGTHWIRGFVPRTGLNSVEKRNYYPYWDSNSDPSAVLLVACHYTD
jgi:hypothetical protein